MNFENRYSLEGNFWHLWNTLDSNWLLSKLTLLCRSWRCQLQIDSYTLIKYHDLFHFFNAVTIFFQLKYLLAKFNKRVQPRCNKKSSLLGFSRIGYRVPVSQKCQCLKHWLIMLSRFQIKIVSLLPQELVYIRSIWYCDTI